MADQYVMGQQYSKIYLISDFTTTVKDSVDISAFDDLPQGIEWSIDEDMFLSDYGIDKNVHLSGFSSTVLNSLDQGTDNPWGISNDRNSDTYINLTGLRKIQKLSGFSSTVLDSFTSSGFDNSQYDVTWDGNDLYLVTSGIAVDPVYRLSGFSSTVLNSIDLSGLGASVSATGLSWTGDDLLVSEQLADVIYRFSGFSTTQLDSVDLSAVDVTPCGISHDDADERTATPINPNLLGVMTYIGDTRFRPGVVNFIRPKLIDFGKRYGGGGGCYRIFGDDEYRFYWDNSTPPVEGSTPDEVNDTFNGYETTDTFGDDTHYISASRYNGLLDSGFGNVGNNGERYRTLIIQSGDAINLPPSAPTDWRIEQVAGGITRIYALYQEYNSPAPDASAVVRAEEWAIAVTYDGSTPPIDTPDYTVPFRGNMAEVLRYDLPAQSHNTVVKIRLQTRRLDGITWIYSENSTVISLVIDTVGPTAPPGGSTWRGAIPEDAL